MPNGHHSEIAMLQDEDHVREVAALKAEIERQRRMLDTIAKHPDTHPLIKQYASEELDL